MALIKAVEPSASFSGVFRKPLTEKACVSNVEHVLRFLYARRCKVQVLPAAIDICNTRIQKSWQFLDAIFQILVMAPVKDSLRNLLEWASSIVSRYGRILQPSTFNPLDFSDGVHFACILHALLSFDLRKIYWKPQSHMEITSNLALVFSKLQEVGIPVCMTVQDLKSPDGDFVMLQIFNIYKALGDRAPKEVAGLRFKDDSRERLVNNLTESYSGSLNYSESTIYDTSSKIMPKGFFSSFQAVALKTEKSTDVSSSPTKSTSSSIHCKSLKKLRAPEFQIEGFLDKEHDEVEEKCCFLLTPRILKFEGRPVVCNGVLNEREDFMLQWRDMETLKMCGNKAVGSESDVKFKGKAFELDGITFECFDEQETQKYVDALTEMKEYRLII